MNQNKINMEQEIVLSLLKQPKHGRAISKSLSQPLTTVQRHLTMLVEANVADCSTEGRNKIYSLKNNLAARQMVYAAEHQKLSKLLEFYPSLAPLLEDILQKTSASLVILYGSYAGFAAKKQSDIDIYIETTGNRPKKTLEMLDTRLSVKTGKFMKQDRLIKEIIKNHVILRGVERYYEGLGVFGKTQDGEKA